MNSPTPSPRRRPRPRPRPRPASPLASPLHAADLDDDRLDRGSHPSSLSSGHHTASPIHQQIQQQHVAGQPPVHSPVHSPVRSPVRSPIRSPARSPVSQQHRWPSSFHSVDETPASRDSFSDITSSLQPVEAYHNGFANVDESPISSSAVPSFASASRAFIAHHRQQSIPNLLPSITSSITRNISRAISPDRSLRAARMPIPVFKTDHGSESHGSENHGRDDDDGNDDDNDEGDNRYDSDDSDHIMATSQSRRGNIYTTYTGRRSNNINNNRTAAAAADNSSVTGTFSHWLSGGTPKIGSSPDLGSTSSSRATTPEPASLVALRGGAPHSSSSRRSMTFESDASSTPRSPALTTSTSPSRFAQLASSMSATLSRLTAPSPVSPRALSVGTVAGLESDELYNLNVGNSLFPSGHPSEHDAFSPSAFKNLEQNASGLLAQFQAAYRQHAVALLDLAGEKSARDEELEEAETRVQHLKMQLEGMARKADEQEKNMKALQEELAAEKKVRAQERAMLVSGVPTTTTTTPTTTTGSTISEDLGVEEAQRRHKRRHWRKSLKSDGSYDDTDEGDEEESAADEDETSVFSRSRSPTIAPSIGYESVVDGSAAAATVVAVPAVSHPRVAALGSGSGSLRGPKPSAQQPPLNTFQKIVKNMTSAIKDEDEAGGPSSCSNCRGHDASFAWNTVSILRDENKQLKQRVGQLEVAVDSALDAVNGVGY